MIGAWMLYGLVVGGLLAVAAAALDRLVRAYGRPARWVWAGAVAGTLLAPAAAWLLGARRVPGEAAGSVVLGSAEVVSAPSFSLEAAARPVLEAMNAPLAALWLVCSTALALYLAATAWVYGRGGGAGARPPWKASGSWCRPTWGRRS
jgi:hypothetical protein